METTVPAPMLRKVLLVKAHGQFKHSGKYYLHNGRWHKLHDDKPAPKGSPVAAHKHAAGQYAPAKHFTDAEWEQLKLPPENVNAGTFNKQLMQLKQLSEAGDVTAILGSQFGTNTYGKKLATIANKLLEMHGSSHKVAPGQKAGTHIAVSQAPEAPAAEQPAPAADPMGAFANLKDDIDAAVASGHLNTLKDIKAYLTKPQNKSEPGAQAALAYLNSKTEDGVKKPKIGPVGHALKEATKEKPATAAEPAAPNKAKDAHAKWLGKMKGSKTVEVDGKPYYVVAEGTKWDNGTTHVHLASADEGTVQPNGWNPKQINTDVATELLHPASGLDMPAFVEGKTTSGVVAFYEKVGQKVIDLAAAGDAAGLEKLKADGLKPNKSGKVGNTWKGKTENSKMLLALHEKALAHSKGNTTADQPAPAATAEPAPAAEASKPAAELSPAEKVKQATQAATAAAAQDPAFKEAVAIASEKTSASKLSQIPWDSQLLPDSNTNAKSHNKQVAKIKALAEAGDLAGLEAMKFGVNTYGKKQEKLKQLAIAALKEDAAEPAAPAATPAASAEPVAEQAQSKPAKPDVSSSAHWTEVADNVEQAMNSGNKAAIELVVSTSNGMTSPNSKAVNEYAKAALQHLNGTQAAEPSIADKIGQAGSASAAKQAAVQHVIDNKQSAEAYDEAIAALKLHGYDAMANLIAEAKAETHGPKEGDTKQGADGMLVFKNGRWHKVKDEAAAANDQHPIDALDMPNLSDLNYPQKAADLLEYLKKKVKEEGPSALKGVTKKMSTSGKLITKLPTPAGGTYKITGYEGMGAKSHNAIYHYVEALKAAVGKPKKVAKPKAAAAPAQAAASAPGVPGLEAMDSWQKTGEQGGSNPGGKYKDHNGVEWYCKFPDNEEHAKAEVLAAKLYGLAGLSSQDCKLITKDGKIGIASKWTDLKKGSAKQLAELEGAHAGFAVDAWLANWDVVGLAYDNLQIGPDGKAHRVDAGGSLMYRAQGAKKAFGETVTEIDSLRDAKINPQAAAVFGSMTEADITASVAKVLAIPDISIRMLVEQFGPGDAAAKKQLADTLIARKADLAAKYPKAVKKKKAPVFKPEKISEPPSFMNWGGSGKPGPSSKDFLNKANDDAVKAIFAAAKTGKIEAVQELTAPTFNKETGAVTGQAKVLEHPSQHVKGYAQQVINEINLQLNPPKRFRFEGGHPLNALNSAYPSFKGATQGSHVKKVGKFILLGDPGTVDIQSLGMPKLTYASGALTQATYSSIARAVIDKMPTTQRQAVRSYTGSGYQEMNHSLWSGNPTGAAKAAGEALQVLGHDIAPGTVLSRKLSVSGSSLDALLGSTGKVLQEPAIMSTSIRPSSWSGNVQLKLHVGPGVKGLWVGPGSTGPGSALSMHASEDEMVLPPNTRILITAVKKSNGSADADGFGNGVSHVIEAIILPTETY